MFIIGWCSELFIFKQLIKYSLVGVFSNIVIYFGYLLLTYCCMTPKKAMTLVYIVGAYIGFFGNRKWTFASSLSLTNLALRYIVTHIFGYALNLLILFFFVDCLGYSHWWIQAIAIIIVASFLFLIFKYLVFNEKNNAEK